MKTEKPILVTHSGRFIPSVSSAIPYCLPKSTTFGSNRTITMNEFRARHPSGRRLRDESHHLHNIYLTSSLITKI
ncbi:unnamed protein product [Hymenolepis diminuta]|uniref:Uncharacterized protein n=1 Tax=Hymenolepis diminuta TaxID=6216 RepID=A0A564YXD0_HYMDI|nr:unnamed protein product [Hymenolepis diminuta]